MIIKNLLVKITQITIFTFFVQSSSFADVYRWVDANGQVNYSDQPQSPAAKRLSLIKTQTKKPLTEDSDKSDKVTSSEKETLDKNSADADKKKKAEKKTQKISKKEKRRLCKEGRDDYKKISSRGRMREINKKGEYVYLSEKQRQKRLAAAKKKQRKYCN